MRILPPEGEQKGQTLFGVVSRKGLTLLFIGALAMCGVAHGQRAESFDKRVRQYVVHDEPTIRIDDVRVVDGTGAPARTGQSVLLRDGRIVAAGPAASLAAEKADRVIEGKGRTLMPGLVMMHEHLFFLDVAADVPNYSGEPVSSPRAYLAYGATTIRTAGSMNGNDDLQAARMVREGKFAGPEIHVTAPFVNGPGSFAYQLRPIAEPGEARRIVRFWGEEGATSYKIYQNISREVLAAAIDEAHKLGFKVTGHLCSVTFAEAAAMGIDNLEHGIAVASDFVRDKQPDACPTRDASEAALLATAADGPEVKAVIDALLRRNVAVTSTLAVLAAGVVDGIPSADDLLYLNTQSQKSALATMARLQRDTARRERALAVLKREMQFERAFVAAGGTLLAGTDPTGWGGTLPGPGNHAALRLLGDAGFAPLDVIRIGTSEGARFLGISERVGTIASGKQADLLLVDGKPDENLRDLARIDLVFRDGIAYDPAKLKESVRGRIGR
jgi:imidazolonepropionase-like amidohydrolase